MGAHGAALRGARRLARHGVPARGAPGPLSHRARDGVAEVAAQERVFHALAHPSRRHILLVLRARGGHLGAGEIARRFACSWPTTTRHLRVLEDAGLVRCERAGRERHYHLDRSRLVEVAGGWLRHFEERPTASARRRR